MTALTQDRSPPRQDGLYYRFPVGRGQMIYAGALVCVEANHGYAYPAQEAPFIQAVGVAEQSVDNRKGDSGDQWIQVRRGVFQFANSILPDDTIPPGLVGVKCYIVDDRTVGLSDDNGNRSPAGYVRQVDESGVWVEIQPGNWIDYHFPAIARLLTEQFVMADGGNKVADFDNGGIASVYLETDTTLSLQGGMSYKRYTLIIEQDHVGGHTLTIDTANINFNAAITDIPPLSMAPDKRDYLQFIKASGDTFDLVAYQIGYGGAP